MVLGWVGVFFGGTSPLSPLLKARGGIGWIGGLGMG